MSRNILLINDEVLIARTQVHGNIDPKLLYPEIKAAQDMYVFPILGTALYNKLLDEVDAGTLTGDYKDLVDDYIIDTLVYYTMSELPLGISYQFWNKGVLRQGGDFTEQPSMNDLVTIADRYKRRAEFYAERLKRFLKADAGVKYPEYINAGSDADTVHPQQATFSMPIWLGDDDGCCGQVDDTPPSRRKKC